MISQVNRTLFLLFKSPSGEDAAWGWYLWAARSPEQCLVPCGCASLAVAGEQSGCNPTSCCLTDCFWEYNEATGSLLSMQAPFLSTQAPLRSDSAPWLQRELCLHIFIWWDSRPGLEGGLRALLKEQPRHILGRACSGKPEVGMGGSAAKWFIQPFATTQCKVCPEWSVSTAALQRVCLPAILCAGRALREHLGPGSSQAVRVERMLV